MDAATARAEVDAGGLCRLLEIRRIHIERRAAHRTIAAGPTAQNWSQQSGFQIHVGLHTPAKCFYLGRRTRGSHESVDG